MGSHYPGSDDEKRALSAYINLLRATESLSALLSQDLAERGLTISQFGALEALYHLGPMCQRALGEKLLKSSGNITLVVDNLVKRGLVRRERGEGDRRYVTIHLTDEGQRLITDVFPKHAATITRLMNRLEPAELETLRALCRKLGKGEESAT